MVHPVQPLPPMSTSSPELVLVLDRIRFRLDGLDRKQNSNLYSEYTWFAREYPRCYRYHLDCAEHRLRGIHALFCEIHKDFEHKVANNPNLFSMSTSNVRVQRIYWDFESFLSAVNTALDLLARVAGTAYAQPMPPSFNKFCKKAGDDGLLGLMKRAQTRWVNRLKDYRDCFVHYTPVDTLLSVSLIQYSDGFHIRAKLPMNPNIRDILGFRYTRDVELLRYACTVWRHVTALDRAVAKEISFLYAYGQYPKRISDLFFLGKRNQTHRENESTR